MLVSHQEAPPLIDGESLNITTFDSEREGAAFSLALTQTFFRIINYTTLQRDTKLKFELELG